jgi:hypothetical protein
MEKLAAYGFAGFCTKVEENQRIGLETDFGRWWE